MSILKQIGRAPSNQNIATFLSGSLDGEFGQDGHNIASLWSCAHNATRPLGARSARSGESWCHRSGPMTTPSSPQAPGLAGEDPEGHQPLAVHGNPEA